MTGKPRLPGLASWFDRWAAILLVFVVALALSQQSFGSAGPQDRDEAEPVRRLRRVFVPFADLADWMRGRPAYLPMSYSRYSGVLGFLNRSDEQLAAQPLYHHLQLNRNGRLQGESLFVIPDNPGRSSDATVDFRSWKLSGDFYRLDPMMTGVDYRPDSVREPYRLTRLKSGVDQDGMFGVAGEAGLKYVLIRYSMQMSTGELFEGRRELELPVSPETQTTVELPDGMNVQSDRALIRQIATVALDSDDFGEQLVMVSTTLDHVRLGFDSRMNPKTDGDRGLVRYRTQTRLTLDSSRHRFETTINLDRVSPDLEQVSILIPPGLSPSSFSVEGRIVTPTLSNDHEGNTVWSVPIAENRNLDEVTFNGELRFATGQMFQVPRVQLIDGLWHEGATNIVVRSPYRLDDFQLIDCRFESSRKLNDRSSVSIRYLDSSSQVRILVNGQRDPKVLGSYTRLSFQEGQVQSQQWIDLDLQSANSTALQFDLNRDWVIGQILGTEPPTGTVEDPSGDTDEPTEPVSLVWYRDAENGNRITVNMPDEFLGRSVRLEFQGQIPMGLGTQDLYEGLRLATQDQKAMRLVSVTSVSPVVATLTTGSTAQAIDVEQARQFARSFDELIQPEPTFRLRGGQPVQVSIASQETSAVNVVGLLDNTILNQQVIDQKFACEVQSYGATLQQFRVFTNQWGSELGAWTLTDSEGKDLEYTSQVTATEQGSLITFRLKQSVSTTLRLFQSRHVRLEGRTTLPAYDFPDAGDYLVRIRDRSLASWHSVYDLPTGVSGESPQFESEYITTLESVADPQSPDFLRRCYYTKESGFPTCQIVRPAGGNPSGVLISEDYLHRIDSQQVRTTCRLQILPTTAEALRCRLPDSSTLDAVGINGVPRPLTLQDGQLILPGVVGQTQVVEVRYTTDFPLELYQMMDQDLTLGFDQTAIRKTQRLKLAAGLSLLDDSPKHSWASELISRWLLRQGEPPDWRYSRQDGAWVPLTKDGSFRLYHQQNHQAWLWFLACTGVLVGLVAFGAQMQIHGYHVLVNAGLLAFCGLVVTFAPIVIAQMFAAAAWGLLTGHCVAAIRTTWQGRAATDEKELTIATIARLMPLILLAFLLLWPESQLAAQQDSGVDQQELSAVIIPVDQDQNPGSVVYLDRKTFDLFSQLEKEMDRQTRVRLNSARYLLTYDPTRNGFTELQLDLRYWSANDGQCDVPLPVDSPNAVDEVTVNGLPGVYRIQNDRIRVATPASDEGELSLRMQLLPEGVQTQLVLNCIPTTDSTLELRGVPTSWMSEILDLSERKILDRSYSQRSFSIERIDRVGVRIAADTELLPRAVQETWVELGVSKVGCRTVIGLGPYGQGRNSLRIRADSRLALPARYYFATEGFQIKEVESDDGQEWYDVIFADRNDLPEWIEIEWETDYSPFGQLIPPDIQVIVPDVELDQYVAVSVDRRLLFQPNAQSGFQRQGLGRLPSLVRQNEFRPEVMLDQVYRRVASVDPEFPVLGDVRLQPVQSSGTVDISHMISQAGVRSQISGALDISLGELSQLRFQVPDGFEPDQVMVGGSELNEATWYRVVSTSEGQELICFLNRPLTGFVQFQVSGQYLTDGPLFTSLLEQQLPGLDYRCHLYHSPTVQLDVKTDLTPATPDAAAIEGFQFHSTYDVSAQNRGQIAYQLNRGQAPLRLEGFFAVRRPEDGQQYLRSAWELIDDTSNHTAATIQLPPGLTDPELVSATADGSDFEATIRRLSDTQFRIEWENPLSRLLLHVIFKISDDADSFSLPVIVEATDRQLHVLDNELLRTEYRPLSGTAIANSNDTVFGAEDSGERRWYEFGGIPSNRTILERRDRVVEHVPPKVLFQQCNYRDLRSADGSMEGLQQIVVKTFESDRRIPLQIPPGCEVVQVWVDDHFGRLVDSKTRDAEVAITVDPLKSQHLISLRLRWGPGITRGLPAIPGTGAVEVYAPAETFTDQSVPYESIRAATLKTLGEASESNLPLVPFQRTQTAGRRWTGNEDLRVLDRFVTELPLRGEVQRQTNENFRLVSRDNRDQRSGSWSSAAMVILCSLAMIVVVGTAIQKNGVALEALHGLLFGGALVYGLELIWSDEQRLIGLALLGLAGVIGVHFAKLVDTQRKRSEGAASL